MKLEVTVTGERVKNTGQYLRQETEPYTAAAITLEGDPGLVANSLRALADSIPRDIR